jgi:hypothetical protein
MMEIGSEGCEPYRENGVTETNIVYRLGRELVLLINRLLCNHLALVTGIEADGSKEHREREGKDVCS